MRRLHTLIGPLSGALLLAAACAGDEDATIDTTARGQATYRDAATDHDGAPRQPAAPPEQPDGDPMRIQITVEGTAEMPDLDPSCALDGATGSFEGIFAGEASLGEDGAYVAGLASADALFSTGTGCEVPDLEITALSEVVVRGEISATTRNCETYCEAQARAHGEAECGAGADAAACRAEAESELAGSCQTECTTTAHAIVAETRLSVDAVAALSARGLTGAALGELEVDLQFERMETADGQVIDD